MPSQKNNRQICILGDSHIVALKNAIENFQLDYARELFVFFAAFGRNMEHTTFKDDRVVPTTKRVKEAFLNSSGGSSDIHLKAYGGFIVSSMGLGIQRYLLQANSHLPLEFTSKNNPCFALSEDGWRVSARDALYGSTAFKFLRYIKENTDAPVAIIPQPAPSETISQAPKALRSYKWLSQPFAYDLFKVLNVFYNEALAQIADDLDLYLIRQCGSTFTEHGMTRSEFHNSKLEDDFNHMNDKYGATILQNIEFKKFLASCA